MKSLDGGIVRRWPSMTTRVVHLTSEPGWTSFVASRADCEMSTRGPKPMPVASRSGSLGEQGPNGEIRLADANDVA